MAKCFTHSSGIPVDFALAMYNIWHNIATPDDWELMDEYEGKGKPIMVWINSIIMDNEPNISDEKLAKEIVWWRRELDKKP